MTEDNTPMTDEEARDMMLQVFGFLRKNILERARQIIASEQHAPMLFAITEEGIVAADLTPLFADRAKLPLVNAFGQAMVEEVDAIATCVVTEVWAADGDSEGRPSEQANRKECLMLQFDSHVGGLVENYLIEDRQLATEPLFAAGELGDTPKGHTYSSRFDFFPIPSNSPAAQA